MRNSLFLLILLFLFVSCGDLFTAKKKDNSSSSTQFATCSLNVEAFSNIFQKNIKGDIYCLEENLNMFMNVVRSDRPGTLSLRELQIYLKKNNPDIDLELMKAIPAVFEVNALMFGDDKEYIQRGSVKKLINFLILLNKEAVEKNIYNYFVDNDRITYNDHQERRHLIYSSVYALSNVLNDFLVKDSDVRTTIKLRNFFDYFRNDKNTESIDKVLEFLFSKKAILGGDEESINNLEFQNLITKVPDVAKIVYDMKNLNKIIYSEEEFLEKIRMYKADMETLESALFYPRDSYIPLFTLDQVKAIISEYVPDFKSYLAYDDVLVEVKDLVFGSNSRSFSAKEVFTLIDHVNYVLEEGEYFQLVFNEFKTTLLSGSKIKFDEFSTQSNYLTERQKEFHKNFTRIVNNYRFFKGKDYIPSFNSSIKRNAEGVFEIGAFEYIIELALKKYGIQNNTGYVLNQDKLVKLIETYKSVLVGEKIIYEERIKNTAETISLLAMLFQNQSNGDDVISTPELTEFVVSLFSAQKLASDMFNYLKTSSDSECLTYRPKLGAQEFFTPECFRREFSNFLNSDVGGENLSSYLGSFVEYFSHSGLDFSAQRKFLQNTEIFSRTCTKFTDDSDVPMKEGDLFVIFTGLLNLEQTYLRFDSDASNILTPDEIEKAYEVYGSAVEGLVPVNFLKSTIAKNMYYYLIKYKEVPNLSDVEKLKDVGRAIKEGGKFLLFALGLKGNKHVNADRDTFTAVLKILGEMSPEAKNNPFDCDSIKDEFVVKENLPIKVPITKIERVKFNIQK